MSTTCHGRTGIQRNSQAHRQTERKQSTSRHHLGAPDPWSLEARATGARAVSVSLSILSLLGPCLPWGPLPLFRLGHRGDNLDCSRSRAERPCCSVLLLGRSPTLKLPASAWRALLGSGPHLRLGESRPRRSSANSGMPTLHWRITFLQLPGFELEGLSLGEALL